MFLNLGITTKLCVAPSNRLVPMTGKIKPMLSYVQHWICTVLLFAFVLQSNAYAARGQSVPQLPQNPADLVRSVIEHELNPHRSESLYSWRQRDERPNRSSTKLMIETPQGVLSRTIAINDRPLTPEQRKKDDDRINRLLDPQKMRDKVREQKEDEERTTKMVRAIPDAFLFQYAGNEVTQNGHTLVKVSFKPNPNFDPPSRETLVFEGMSGWMILDVTAQRIARIDGTLFRDVNIGWGIIGHLDRGGRFYVEQADVHNGHWDQVKMILDFTGKALIFKNIRIKETDTAWDFKPVEKMTVAEALNFLRAEDEKRNHEENAAAGGK
jgi:hypothetical protein